MGGGGDGGTGDPCGLGPGTTPPATEPLIVGYHLSSPSYGLEMNGGPPLTGGPLSSGPVVTSCGGSSANFDGSSSYLSGTASSASGSLATKSSSMTVSAWVYVDTALLPPPNAALVSTINGTTGFFLGMDSTGANVTFSVYQPGGILKSITTTGTPATGWHRITAKYNGANMAMVLDGTPVSSTPVSGPFSPSGTLSIGRSSTAYWRGSVGEVRVYAM